MTDNVYRFQLTCPYCKKEFAYNGGDIDSEIERLKIRNEEIQLWLNKYKWLDEYKQRELRQTRYYKIQERQENLLELKKLKAKRKVANEHINRTKLEIFAQLVRDEIGEEKHRHLMQKAATELEAYRVSDMAWHEFTRSGAKKNVTSINKI